MSDPRMVHVVQAGPVPLGKPIFDRIAVVGLGLIGGSIALSARRAWPASLVIGVDRNEVLGQAIRLHAVDVAADDLAITAEADLVVLAAPVREILALLAELPDRVRTSAVITDVGSTKRAIVEAARVLPSRLSFVGGHPVAGMARSGLAAARPDLFAGRRWIFTPEADAPADVVERLFAFATALGAEPCRMTAADHDRVLAFTSHLPQLVSTALMLAVGESVGAGGLRMAGTGLRDTTRLAESPVSVWPDICATNADELGPALDQLIALLESLRESLTSAEAIEDLFTSANAWRGKLSAS